MFIFIMVLYVIGMFFVLIGGGDLGFYLVIKNSEYLYNALILIVIGFAIMMAIQFIPVHDKQNRTRFVIEINKTAEEVDSILKKFLEKKSYVLGQWNGEDVYKNGNGILIGRKFIRYYFEENNLIVEGWTTFIGMYWTSQKEFPVDDKYFLKVTKTQIANLIDQIRLEISK